MLYTFCRDVMWGLVAGAIAAGILFLLLKLLSPPK